MSNLNPIVSSTSSPKSSTSLTSLTTTTCDQDQQQTTTSVFLKSSSPPNHNEMYRLCFSASAVDFDCDVSFTTSTTGGESQPSVERVIVAETKELNKIYYDPSKKESSAYV